MKSNVIKATMQGHCAICNKTYPPNTRIVKDNKTGKWVMADCLWPEKSKTPNADNNTIPKQQEYRPKDEGATDHSFHLTPKQVAPDIQYPEVATEKQIDVLWTQCYEKAKEITGEPNTILAMSFFNAKLKVKDQAFDVAYSKMIAKQKAKEQEQKISNIEA